MDALGTLNCIYFFLFAVGLGYAIIAALMGQFSHFDLPGVDIDIPGVDLHPGGPDLHLELPFGHDMSHDIDHPEVGLSPLSPITIATFITTFGGVGLIVNNATALSPLMGLLVSTAGGLLLSGLMFFLYARLLVAAQGSSEVKVGELVGKIAQVTAPIPADQMGEVSFVARGSRVTAPARSADGVAIRRGTNVVIVAVGGSAMTVRAQETPPVASKNS